MLTSFNVKSREVCIKARSPLAALAFIGKVTKFTTMKWSIGDEKYFDNEVR